MSAASVTVSTAPNLGAGRGSIPTAALQDVRVRPIPQAVSKAVVIPNHYLHSLPGGTRLSFGIFLGSRLLGAVTLGVGPYNVPRLVAGASADDCLTLTRLWLSDVLPKNSESRVLGIVLRSLKLHTPLKFIVSYADPTHGHVGTIYQGSNWLYSGLSQPTPLYDLGDGRQRHCRSVATSFGTRSVRHLSDHGIPIELVPQGGKHRYFYFLDPTWQSRLRVSTLPYPKGY